MNILAELEDFMKATEFFDPADDRPVIRIEPGNIESVVDQAEKALIASNRGLYQRAHKIVSVAQTKDVPASDHGTAFEIVERGEHALREDLAAVAIFERFDRRNNRVRRIDPPATVVKTLQERTVRLNFPVLKNVISAPTLRPDGSLVDQPGYDANTGLLFDPGVCVFPRIAEAPSLKDATAALGLLNSLISSFPFVGDEDRAVALSAMLTACVRSAFSTAPLHGFSAPVAGSGKSMLVDIASVLATGRQAGVIAQGKSEEEMEKRLGSLILAGVSFVSIDNCEAALGGEFLCQALTQPRVRVRRLQTSDVSELSTGAFIAATGNGLRLEGDMTRRALMCNLNPDTERPELRRFDVNPVAVAKENRAQYVVAILTILRAYITAGQPDIVEPLGSFDMWSNLVRSALIWVGCADPVDTMETIRQSDPKLEQLTAVMAQWKQAMGSERFTVQQVITKATEKTTFNSLDPGQFVRPDFREALLAVAGQGGVVNSCRLGKWLGAQKDRIRDGVCFRQSGISSGFMTWRIANANRPETAF